MIQRVQSVYLLASFLLFGTAASLLYATPEVALGGNRLVFAAGAAFVGIVGLAAIFLFKNRSLQASVVGLLRAAGVLFILALWGFLYVHEEVEVLAAGGLMDIAGILIAPVLACVSFHLARRAIGRDIDLIRSMDRIR